MRKISSFIKSLFTKPGRKLVGHEDDYESWLGI